MEFRYSEWQARHEHGQSTFDKLLDVFKQLLMYTQGDPREALNWMTQLDKKYGLTSEEMGMGDFIERLKREGYLKDDEPGEVLHLTGKMGKTLRQDALNEIFTSLRKSGGGQHRSPVTGRGDERLPELRSYQFGDPVTHIDGMASLTNALTHSSLDDIRLTEDDFRVYESEHLTSCATVLMIDVSHSMILYGEDRFTPAKKVAMALSELILTRYPKDTLDILLFGDDAWKVEVKDLPTMAVGPYHTNTKAGLGLARQILRRRKNVNKQVFMITDGKPSAIYEGAKLYKNSFGLDRKIVNKTLDEAVMCRREGIEVTTFMVTSDPYLQGFVQELTEANQGRAYYSNLSDLGEYIFVDYIRNRRKNVR